MDKDRIILLYISGGPGFGQMYNGETNKGVLLLVSWILSTAVFFILLLGTHADFIAFIFVAMAIGIQIYGFVDAVFIGYKKNEYRLSGYEQEQFDKKMNESGFGPKKDQAASPIPKGGFQRKMKGDPKFKPFDPID